MMTFTKHAIALELQKVLKEGFYKVLQLHYKPLDDITMIYDHPIRYCLDLLSLYHNRSLESRTKCYLEKLHKQYEPYHQKALTGLENEDLIPLIHSIQTMTSLIIS